MSVKSYQAFDIIGGIDSLRLKDQFNFIFTFLYFIKNISNNNVLFRNFLEYKKNKKNTNTEKNKKNNSFSLDNLTYDIKKIEKIKKMQMIKKLKNKKNKKIEKNKKNNKKYEDNKNIDEDQSYIGSENNKKNFFENAVNEDLVRMLSRGVYADNADITNAVNRIDMVKYINNCIRSNISVNIGGPLIIDEVDLSLMCSEVSIFEGVSAYIEEAGADLSVGNVIKAFYYAFKKMLILQCDNIDEVSSEGKRKVMPEVKLQFLSALLEGGDILNNSNDVYDLIGEDVIDLMFKLKLTPKRFFSINNVIATNYYSTTIPVQLPLSNKDVSSIVRGYVGCIDSKSSIRVIGIKGAWSFSKCAKFESVVGSAIWEISGFELSHSLLKFNTEYTFICDRGVSSSILHSGNNIKGYVVYKGPDGNYFSLACYLTSDKKLHIDLNREEDEYPYRVKKPTMQGVKTNVWFTSLMVDLKKSFPHIYQLLMLNSGFTVGYTNDQICSIAMLMCMLYEFDKDSVKYLLILFNSGEDNLKEFSNIMKTCGGINCEFGMLWTELISLKGMPEVMIDTESKIKERLILLNDMKVHIDKDDLRSAIYEVIRNELKVEKIDFNDPEMFWKRRWAWTKNGAHNMSIYSHYKKYPDFQKLLELPKGRYHRREAMENIDENAMLLWPAEVVVTASVKPEIGKPGRMIFGCDTVSYSAFSNLMEGIERAWRNNRVIIDPGNLGHSRLGRKINSLRDEGNLHVMLDYDSFDTQHSIESQKMVIEALCDLSNYNEFLSGKLISSFDNMFMYHNGKYKGRVKGTLMSGHRCTTIINSILNAAYLMAACPTVFNEVRSMHVGDDVYISAKNFDQVDLLMKKVNECNIKMNRSKQSLGFCYAEFLRLVVKKDRISGYCSRIIPRIVSGNWEGEDLLNSREFLSMFYMSSISLMNRGFNKNAYLLLTNSMCKNTSLSATECNAILSGRCSIGKLPNFFKKSCWEGFDVLEVDIEDHTKTDYESNLVEHELKSSATKDYLAEGAADLERYALELSKASPSNRMLGASYARNQLFLKDKEYLEIKLSELRVINTRGGFNFESMHRYDLSGVGVLTRYPLLNLIRKDLGIDDLRILIRKAGFEPSQNIIDQAWGTEKGNNVVVGQLSFQDACEVDKYYERKLVNAKYKVFV